MNLLTAIKSRKSVRTFNGLRLDEATLTQLRHECNQLSAIDSTVPGCLRNVTPPRIVIADKQTENGALGTYGVISGARTFAIMAYESTPEAMLLAGYRFEQFILNCTKRALGSCWIGGTFGRSNFQRAYLTELQRLHLINNSVNSCKQPTGTDREQPTVTDNHKEPTTTNNSEQLTVGIISPLGHATPKTRFAERFMRRVANANNRRKFTDLFTGIEPPTEQEFALATADTTDLSTHKNNIDAITAVKIALEMVRLAPSSRNSQPWRATVTTAAPTTVAHSTATATDSTTIETDSTPTEIESSTTHARLSIFEAVTLDRSGVIKIAVTDGLTITLTCATANQYSHLDMGIALCHLLLTLDHLLPSA